MKKVNGRFVPETDQEYRKLDKMRFHQRKARQLRKILETNQELLT